MAIIVDELISGKPGSEEITEKGIRASYSRTFKVYDSALDLKMGPKQAIDELKAQKGLYLGIIYNTGTEIDFRAILKVFRAQDNGDGTFNVSAEYGSRLDIDPGQLNENPLLRPYKISLSTSSYSITKTSDENNKPVVNSANERFDPMPQVNVLTPTFTVERNFGVDNTTTLVEYCDSVNSTTWFGWEAGSLRISNIAQDGPQWENGILFWSVKVTFEHRANRLSYASKVDGASSADVDGWDELFLDEGINEISGSSTKAIPDAAKRPATMPKLLDGAGAEVTSITTANINYERFQFNKRKDFNALGLI